MKSNDRNDLLSNVILQSDIQAMLLGIFQHLDPLDMGEVHVDLLLQALFIFDDTIANEVNLVDSIGRELWTHMMNQLQLMQNSKLTWGEVSVHCFATFTTNVLI